MEDHTDVLVGEAQDLLDKHQLDEAEALFLRVLHELTDTNPERERIGVSTLVGLAEIYTKRGRSMRYDLLEWYRMLLHAVTLQEEAQVLCQKIMDDPCEASSLSMTWLEDTRSKSAMQLNVLENTVVNSLQSNVKHALANRRRTEDPATDLQAGWLRYLQNHCCENRVKAEEPELDNMIVAAESEESLESTQSQPIVQRKIDFDKVQSAIMTLVKEITSDIRMRHSRHRKLPEETIKRSLSYEMQNKLSPSCEHSDIISLFEDAIIYEEQEKEAKESETKSEDGSVSSENEDDAFMNDPYPMELIHTQVSQSDHKESLYTQESITYDNELIHPRESFRMTPSSSHQSFSGQSVPLTRVKTMRMKSVTEDDRQVKPHHRTSKVKRSHTMPPRLRVPSEEIDGEQYNISGVLTVWRSHNRAPPLQTHIRRYTLSSYEEMSSLTETAKFFEVTDTDERDEEKEPRYLDQNLMSPGRMKNTLGCMLAKVAAKLQKEPHMKEALELNKFALGLFQELPISELNPNIIGLVLKNVGKIKCEQGDMEGGAQLMEEAMSLFGAEEEDSVQVAETLFDLGNAYMAEHWNDFSLFQHVLRIVRDDVDSEFREELNAELDVADDESDSDTSEGGESYTVCTHEAMCCYNQALEILSRLRKQNEEHTSLYVEVLTKLADCCIMVSNYDKAILCYEEALILFRNTLGVTSLPNNAHVLSMLGTANFLLSNYPKAVSMYETAYILQQHLQGERKEDPSFESTFTLTMLGICFYTMHHYEKCVGWCLRAYDTYNTLYNERLVDVETLNKWFIIQTLYTLGYSYSTLCFNEKALHHLFLSNFLLQQSEDRDIKQLVRVLKTVADVYNNMEDHTSALTYYNNALEESHALGDEKTATALQNQLLNKIAGVHVSTRQYGTAAEYLEKALDYQKNVQTSIRGDLLGIMHQLGITYTLSGDIDRAIECYKECLETYQDLHGSPALDMSKTLCNLGTLYHVKACIQDEGDDVEEEYLHQAEECYQEAIRLDPRSRVSVQYANFLYQQGQSDEALLTMLPILFCRRYQDNEVMVYYGVEQAVLPDHLQHEMDDMDEFCIETRVFAHFLAILCYKHLLLTKDAEDCLIHMCDYVTTSRIPLNHSVLGYSLLEMNMYEEAADSFRQAAQLQESKELSIVNYTVSVYLWIYTTITCSLYWTWYELFKPFELDMPMDEPVAPHFVSEAHVQVVATSPVYPEMEFEVTINDQSAKSTIEDSGYYDQTLVKSQEKESEVEKGWQEEPVTTSSTILEAVRKKTAMIRDKMEGKATDESEKVDILTTIRLEAASRYAPRARSPRSITPKPEEDPITESGYGGDWDKKSEEEEQWVTYEETVDTPAEILFNYKSTSDELDDDNAPEKEEEEEETWITEECVVETPAEVLKMLELRASYITEETETTVTEHEVNNENEWGLHSEITIEEPENTDVQMTAIWEDAQQSSTEEERHDSDEWVTMEEVSETPLEVLRHLQALQSSTQSQSTPQEEQEPKEEEQEEVEEEEEWVSEEVAVELPEDILKQIKSQQEGARIPWRTDERNGTAEGTQESLDMPVEVLDFIKEQEEKQNQLKQRSSTPETSYKHQQISNSDETRDQGYGSYSSRYSRWSSYQEPKQTDFYKTSTKTVSVDSPTAILNAINGNTQSPLYTSTQDTQDNDQGRTEEDEEQWETWESTEETVEAPPELLAILMQQQQQQR